MNDKTIIYEAARIALADADLFDYLADMLDITDEELQEVTEEVQNYLAD